MLKRAAPVRIRATELVELLHTGNRLTIRAETNGHAVAYNATDLGQPAQIVAPCQLFMDCAGRKPVPVTVRPTTQGRVQAQWCDRSIPQTYHYDVVPSDVPKPFPIEPDRYAQQSATLLPALAAAAEVCDPHSSRYALGCIQLRGSRGDLVVTDGHQLLVQRGFEFGFPDVLLIPGSRVFAAPLLKNRPFDLGITNEHAVMQIGEWIIWLPLPKDARYPQVDDTIPSERAALTEVRLPPTDLQFLAERLDRLPGRHDPHAPLTVDLNGSIAIRARSGERSAPVELVLSNAVRTGEQICFNTNRSYLERAARLGLQRMFVFGNRLPILCCDANRSYVWAPLEPEAEAPSGGDVVRIRSPLDEHVAASAHQRQPSQCRTPRFTTRRPSALE